MSAMCVRRIFTIAIYLAHSSSESGNLKLLTS